MSDYARSIYNNMVLNYIWDVVDPKDIQIIALYTKVAALKGKQGGYKDTKGDKGDDTLVKHSNTLSVLYLWRKINVRVKIFKDSI